MSSYEYNDLFLKCQNTAPYHVFTFDIVGSKKMKDRNQAQKQLQKLALLTYKCLEQLEKEKGIKILVRPFYQPNASKTGYTQENKEPVIIGDLLYFTIYRGTLTREEVLEIFNCCKAELNINFEFHYADGYYETNDWREGQDKYFRGYCIETLSTLHKDYNKTLRKKLENNK